MLIRRAEIEASIEQDVRITDGWITQIGPGLTRNPDETTLEADGGALLPGLHDHHLHLFSLAQALRSVACGPPQVCTASDLGRALAHAPFQATDDPWIRGIGYHESVAGPLDRVRLDAFESNRPVRIQQRSGALWIVNSRGATELGLDSANGLSGVECDRSGRPNGRLFRLDRWMRQRLATRDFPNLARVSRQLARCGVSGVTDATAENGCKQLHAFEQALQRGELLQKLCLLGTPELPEPSDPRVSRGGVKLLLEESRLPTLETLCAQIDSAHDHGRPVAIHCVTRTELVMAASALEMTGGTAGDRIEHAGVAPPDVLALLAPLRVSVVSQPGFLYERGDAYRIDVDEVDRPWLWRGRGFTQASIPFGAGTDAPFGDPDPWIAIRSAVERRTRQGATLGPEEALSPERALALFTTSARTPGGPPRSVRVGARADLCLLDCPWKQAREELSSRLVAATMCDGIRIWPAD